MSCPPGTSVGSPPPPPSATRGSRFAREAYSAAVRPAGPEPRITTLYSCFFIALPWVSTDEVGDRFRRPGDHRAVALHDDGPLDQTGVRRHQLEELGVGMAA